MWLLIIKQKNAGCDHSIDCGTKIIELNTSCFSDAKSKAKDIVMECPEWLETGSPLELCSAEIVEYKDYLDLDDLEKEHTSLKVLSDEAKKENAEKIEFERLRKKFESK